MLRRSVETLSEILGADISGSSTPRHQDLFSSTLGNTPNRHETYRLEATDGLALPSVVVPASFDVEDFFATAATYYQDHSPLSALVHVLGEATGKLLTSPPRMRPSVTKCQASTRGRLVCIGAAVGESILSALTFAEAGGAPSYAACKRTLAFSLGRATLLYDSEIRPKVVAERWCKLRSLTGLGVSPTSVEAVLRAHAIAFGNDDGSLPELPPDLVDGLRSIAKGEGENGDLLLQVLTRRYPGMRPYVDDLRGAFDGRMIAFTRLVDAILTNKAGIHADEIAVAYICNRILPGSFAHVGVLEKLVEFFPSAIIWYGFFSALSKPSASNSVGRSLVAKLERDLLEPFSFEQRPKCDISLEELEVLTRSPLRSDLVKPSQQRSILVALLPGLDIYTRFGVETEAAAERVRRDVETEELNSRVSRLLEEALYILKRARPTGRGSSQGAGGRGRRKDR